MRPRSANRSGPQLPALPCDPGCSRTSGCLRRAAAAPLPRQSSAAGGRSKRVPASFAVGGLNPQAASSSLSPCQLSCPPESLPTVPVGVGHVPKSVPSPRSAKPHWNARSDTSSHHRGVGECKNDGIIRGFAQKACALALGIFGHIAGPDQNVVCICGRLATASAYGRTRRSN